VVAILPGGRAKLRATTPRVPPDARGVQPPPVAADY
jgi:hypothetical protein